MDFRLGTHAGAAAPIRSVEFESMYEFVHGFSVGSATPERRQFAALIGLDFFGGRE
jgi:hypothetical protein